MLSQLIISTHFYAKNKLLSNEADENYYSNGWLEIYEQHNSIS